jgi:hypothetical protein
MKKFINISTIALLIIFFSCKKEFVRDNPNDANDPTGYKGAVSFSRAAITNDYSSNGVDTHNGQINMGERIWCKVYVKNPGTKIIKNVTASISQPSGSVGTFTTDTIQGSIGYVNLTFGNIQPGQEAECKETIYFEVDNGAPDNGNINFPISITDSDGHAATSIFTFKIVHFTSKCNFRLFQPVILSTVQWDN